VPLRVNLPGTCNRRPLAEIKSAEVLAGISTPLSGADISYVATWVA